MQLCPFERHSPSNPTDTKKRKSTVVSNFLPKRFARFALGGVELGGRRGAPPKRQNCPPVCSQNATSWKSCNFDHFGDRDIVRLVVPYVGVHPHDKLDVVFRWTTYPINRKSPVLVSGGPRGVRTGGPKGGTDLPIFRILGVLRSDVSNQSGRRLQYKSSTFEEIWTTLARKFPIPIFPANPSGRRFLYKSSTFEEIWTTLVR